jgi:hypothetical protein
MWDLLVQINQINNITLLYSIITLCDKLNRAIAKNKIHVDYANIN